MSVSFPHRGALDKLVELVDARRLHPSAQYEERCACERCELVREASREDGEAWARVHELHEEIQDALADIIVEGFGVAALRRIDDALAVLLAMCK